MHADLSASWTTSTFVDPFPIITASQHANLKRIVAAVPRGVSTWKDFEAAADSLGIDLIQEGCYDISLKLSSQMGMDWKEKFRSAMDNLAERGYVFEQAKEEGRRHGRSNKDQGGASTSRVAWGDESAPGQPRRSSSSRPSSGAFALLQAQVAAVTAPTPPSPAPRQSSTTPARSRLPPSRSFLTRATNGGSSSDDYVGVPFTSRTRAELTGELPTAPASRRPRIPSPSPPPPTSRHRHHEPYQQHPERSERIFLKPLTPTTPATPVISVARPTDEELRALEYHRISLLTQAWSSWRAEFLSRQATLSRVDCGRSGVLLRWSLRVWREKLEALERLEEQVGKMEEGRRGRLRLAAFLAWKKRCKEKRQKRWEASLMKVARRVRTRMNDRLKREALQLWKEKLLDSRATKFRRTNLLAPHWHQWRARLELNRNMAAAAEETRRSKVVVVAGQSLQRWHQRTELQSLEREWIAGKDEKLARDYLWHWDGRARQAIQQRALEIAADNFDRQRRLRGALERWSLRHAQLEELEVAADHSISANNHRLRRTYLKHWQNSYVGRLLADMQATRRVRSCFARWRSRYHLVSVELVQTAVGFAHRTDGALRQIVMEQWTDAYNARRDAAATAEAFANRLVGRRALTRWIEVYARRERSLKGGDLARTFLMRQTAWCAWKRAVKRRRKLRDLAAREAVLEERRKKDAFALWLKITRRNKEHQAALETLQASSNARLLRTTLSHWTDYVIGIKEMESKAQVVKEAKLLGYTYDKWSKATLRLEDCQGLAGDFIVMQQEKIARKTVRHWLRRTRDTVEHRLRLEAFQERSRTATLVRAFDRWRDVFLREAEFEVVERGKNRLVASCLATWQSRTKMLPAIQFDREHTLRRAFETWRQWSTPAELLELADNRDWSATLGPCWAVWRIRLQSRIARRSVNRFTSLSSASRRVSSSTPPRPHSAIDSSPNTSYRQESPVSVASPARPASSAAHHSGTSVSPSLVRRTSTSTLTSPISPTSPFSVRPRLSSDFSSERSFDRRSDDAHLVNGVRERLRAAAVASRQG